MAHTAGVIGGLIECGAEIQVVSSDRLAGVQASVAFLAVITSLVAFLTIGSNTSREPKRVGQA